MVFFEGLVCGCRKNLPPKWFSFLKNRFQFIAVLFPHRIPVTKDPLVNQRGKGTSAIWRWLFKEGISSCQWFFDQRLNILVSCTKVMNQNHPKLSSFCKFRIWWDSQCFFRNPAESQENISSLWPIVEIVGGWWNQMVPRWLLLKRCLPGGEFLGLRFPVDLGNFDKGVILSCIIQNDEDWWGRWPFEIKLL